MMKVEISMGDYVDRHTILDIKKDNGLDVDIELNIYEDMLPDDFYKYYFNILKSINSQLWILEDRKRKGVERYSTDESDVAFIITSLNDLRHETKKRIDQFFKSEMTEKKSH
jgi:hypothetical protein